MKFEFGVNLKTAKQIGMAAAAQRVGASGDDRMGASIKARGLS